MENRYIELNKELAKIDEKITIVEKLSDEFSKERSEFEIDLENKDAIRYQNHSDKRDFEDCEDHKDSAEVEIERSKKSTVDRNRDLSVEQCEVGNFMKEELKVHIRMIHDKGRSVRREDTEEGEDHSTRTEHHAGKQVIRGQ